MSILGEDSQCHTWSFPRRRDWADAAHSPSKTAWPTMFPGLCQPRSATVPASARGPRPPLPLPTASPRPACATAADPDQALRTAASSSVRPAAWRHCATIAASVSLRSSQCRLSTRLPPAPVGCQALPVRLFAHVFRVPRARRPRTADQELLPQKPPIAHCDTLPPAAQQCR